MPETKYFSKDITLSTHSVPPNTTFPAKLAYWTLGSPLSPAILLPTCYGGTLASTSPFLYADDGPLPPSKYFLIVVALLGGGESSSPSNTPAPYNGPEFPKTTYEDNICLQYALCQELGIKRLHAYIGFSMGGQQAYHMSTLYPDFVENMVCMAGSARTSWHNWCFLEGPKQALINSVDFHDGHYTDTAVRGTKAFFRVYSTWALSPEWFRQKSWEASGFDNLEAYLGARWSGPADANDLLALLWTWQQGDIGVYHPDDGGDLTKTLARIKARCLIMPSRTDQYFPAEDNAEEVKHLNDGVCRPIETIWGHIAGGGGGTKEDTEFMKSEIAKFLQVS
ncbi:Homoserine O-acetyltransferase [Fulvia fulva]|uniref:Homoserine O-acetyltransferase n=1 Tax=Passalora fulva TaxID=5499 RepID=A0A9Q8LFM4_PASFU|nr:Homoserine O-acetyltransferase [Fulvia fulva]KAK4615338.1 Homoserine O-acetyltransferase [Fulvia fulva]KAK4617321.1 Homoserine O-acetyltransferase [Fulvia fulva]UJO16541.1 Homoserine O-acetyltransferase [Fulvia fulva]WPV19573.1 Homoserine O-acetyltransferase [Fulvia fulva]WPV34448.1 Homoserine O-acetyltransferase [Fulvia fulva]